MAKENVNVADELKDERQKANLTQSAREAEIAQVIAETDTDEEATTETEANEPQLPKIYVKRKRYTNKTDGKQYWEYVTSAMMRGSVSEVHFKASDVGGYEALGLNYAYSRNPVTLYRYLKRNGFYDTKKTYTPYKPKPYDTPEQIGVKMQMDVKYVPKECIADSIIDDERFYQYGIIDEATRERFIYPYREQNADSTVDFVKRAIAFFGYTPQIIQTDNGSEFTFTQKVKNDRKHSFDIFCEQHGIEHKLIKPRTPRHNGKIERSHRCDNERFYKYLRFHSFDDLKMQMKAYLKRSNNIPISTLCSSDKTKKWLTPNEKRKELLLLDWGVIE